MLENVYRVEGKYPDPHGIKNSLTSLRSNPSKEKEYKQFLSEIRSSGLSSHPLLRQFFVES